MNLPNFFHFFFTFFQKTFTWLIFKSLWIGQDLNLTRFLSETYFSYRFSVEPPSGFSQSIYLKNIVFNLGYKVKKVYFTGQIFLQLFSKYFLITSLSPFYISLFLSFYFLFYKYQPILCCLILENFLKLVMRKHLLFVVHSLLRVPISSIRIYSYHLVFKDTPCQPG